jgi:hypothetical protein
MAKSKSVHLNVTCPHCGKPLTKTSRDFGMDCEGNCGQKAFDADPRHANQRDAIMKLAKSFMIASKSTPVENNAVAQLIESFKPSEK